MSAGRIGKLSKLILDSGIQKARMMSSAADTATLKQKMTTFHALHKGQLLLLPNAWDVASAKIFEREGAKAIATTSAGVAQCLGYADGGYLPKDIMLTAIGRIITSVNVPVSVDLEAGFGNTVEEVCDTVQRVMDLGAVGINLEDLDPATELLIPVPEQVQRVEAIRKLADSKGLPFFINARTDVYLGAKYADWAPDKKYEQAMERLLAYQAAGADGLFVPGLADLAVIGKICEATKLPVNVLAGAWITSSGSLKDAGVARVSVGSGIFRAALTNAAHSYGMVLRDDFSFLKKSLSYDEINQLFK